MKKYLLVGGLLLSGAAFAQTVDPNSDTTRSLYRLTVDKDILNLKFEGDDVIPITSASGKEEDVNKTPYSASVITKQEIERAGAVTIPEALRLAPGLLVRQTTNGLYEVHILGTETLPIAGSSTENRSKMVLVMINNMPLNNTFDGGIVWETLPISVGDIEKIEIVRSPSSVFFGRDAASGIINFITTNPESNKLTVQGSVQAGTAQTSVNQASVNFGVRDKLFVRISGKYISTRRFQDEFYVLGESRYISSDSLLFYKSDIEKTNLYGTLARQDYALNSFVRYTPNEKLDFSLSFSNQHSEGQNVYGSFEDLPLTRRTSATNLINLNSKVYGMNVQASYIFGVQNLAVGYPGYQFDTHTLNARMFYDIHIKSFSLVPGISYQQAGFNDLAYQPLDSAHRTTINGNKSLSNYGVFLKANTSLLEGKLNIDGGLRNDFYAFNKQSVLSYQLAAAYNPVDIALVRVSYSLGNLGTFANDAFNESSRTISDGTVINRSINQDLRVSQASNFEIGTRINATDKIEIGIDYFMVTNKDLTYNKTVEGMNGTIREERTNSAIVLKRNGITTNVTASLSTKFKLHAFVTFQRTRFNTDAAILPGNFSPKYFGGLTANFNTLLDRLNIGLSAYVYDKHDMITFKGTEPIASKVIPSIKASYKVWQENAVFINVRNFSNTSSREFIYSDKIPALYLLGVNLNF